MSKKSEKTVPNGESTQRPLSFIFTDAGAEEYDYWVGKDPRVARQIDRMIDKLRFDPTAIIEQSTALRGRLSGCYSQQITDKHALVYTVLADRRLAILRCRNPDV